MNIYCIKNTSNTQNMNVCYNSSSGVPIYATFIT